MRLTIRNKVIIPLAIASKTMKCLEINLTKIGQDIYTENNKTLLRENFKVLINKWTTKFVNQEISIF